MPRAPGRRRRAGRAAARQAVRVARSSGWRLVARRHLFLIPPFVRTAAPWMIELERRFERIPVLAGGVCLRLALDGG